MNNSISIGQYIPEDFPEYYELVKQADVMHFIAGRGLTEQEAKAKFESIFEIYRRDPSFGHFKVSAVEDTFIGTCKLERYKYDRSLLEIGYIVNKDYWRKGYGSRICETLLELASNLDPSAKVIGVINPKNTASRKLLEKFGFRTYFIGVEDNVPTEKLMRF